MTKQELQHFKQHISKALDIGSPGCSVYNFLPEDILEAGMLCLPVYPNHCSCFCSAFRPPCTIIADPTDTLDVTLKG